MPNPVQAAAEGLPNPDRRSFLRNSASAALTTVTAVPLVAGIAEAAETATVAELPIQHVIRIAKMLSKALDEVNADAFDCEVEGGEISILTAHVWPSRVMQHITLQETDITPRMVRT